jgi:hypothetical protein
MGMYKEEALTFWSIARHKTALCCTVLYCNIKILANPMSRRACEELKSVVGDCDHILSLNRSNKDLLLRSTRHIALAPTLTSTPIRPIVSRWMFVCGCFAPRYASVSNTLSLLVNYSGGTNAPPTLGSLRYKLCVNTGTCFSKKHL